MTILPFEIDATIKSECWTYYKMGIIETTKRGREWLATHMQVYADLDSVAFGDGFAIYSSEYYDSILDYSPEHLYCDDNIDITARIKRMIDEGYYVWLDCNIAKISQDSSEDFHIHELLLYGYDADKKIFLSPLLNDATGHPEVTEITFERIEASYTDIIKHYVEHPDLPFWRAYGRHYPITKFKLKKLSFSKENLTFQCLKKIESEFNAERRVYSRINQDDTSFWECNHYFGLGCLLGIKKLLLSIISGEYDMKNSWVDMTTSFLRLYEHRLILFKTLTLLDENTEGSLQNQGILKQYYDCTEKIKGCYMLSEKWYINSDKRALQSIIKILDASFERENTILRLAFNLTQEYIIKYYRDKGVTTNGE